MKKIVKHLKKQFHNEYHFGGIRTIFSEQYISDHFKITTGKIDATIDQFLKN